MSTAETIDTSTAPEQPNGQEPNSDEAQHAPEASVTIGRIIRNLDRHERLLLQIQRRHAEETTALQARIQRLTWLRACHARGFDVARLAEVNALFEINGDLRAVSASTAEQLIRTVAQDGGCYLNLGATRIIGFPDTRRRILDEQERDAVIYFLANLHRLPPLAPEPAPTAQERGRLERQDGAGMLQKDIITMLAAALRGILEGTDADEPISATHRQQGWAALYTLEDPFPDD